MSFHTTVNGMKDKILYQLNQKADSAKFTFQEVAPVTAGKCQSASPQQYEKLNSFIIANLKGKNFILFRSKFLITIKVGQSFFGHSFLHGNSFTFSVYCLFLLNLNRSWKMRLKSAFFLSNLWQIFPFRLSFIFDSAYAIFSLTELCDQIHNTYYVRILCLV